MALLQKALTPVLLLLLISNASTAWTWKRPDSRLARSSCENTATSRGCWGEYSIDTDWYNVFPDTGVTREYWLIAQNVTLAPDGYERTVLTFNGTLPGPTIEANWGDNLVIHVTNNLTNNGTTVHWHGIRQLGSNEYDGVPGLTQCPIPPGQTITYKFRATQYGTSWYHSHYSVQLADGMYGAILIHGPSTANYDHDLGPVFVSDWFHSTAFSMWDLDDQYGGWPVAQNSVPVNGLFNGTNVFDCSSSYDDDSKACLGTGARSETYVTAGKKYRFRIISPQVDGWMKFSIDGHNLTVIAADFVPLVPYVTNNIILTSGQRYDVVVHMNQAPDNYWMRAIYQTGCNLLSTDNANNVRGILRYEDQDSSSTTNTSALPESTEWADITNSCGDEPYDNLVPWVKKNVGSKVEQSGIIDVGFFYQTNLVYHWTLQERYLTVDWERPTNLMIYQNQTTTFPESYNVHSVPGKDQWTYWVIQDLTLLDTYHPFHLHGHDFYILAQEKGAYDPLTVSLNLINPPRRDTATMPGDGFIVIAFITDNPGTWLLHCHIVWHASQSLALQFVERQSEIADLMVHDFESLNDTCSKWTEYYNGTIYKQDDSGI